MIEINSTNYVFIPHQQETEVLENNDGRGGTINFRPDHMIERLFVTDAILEPGGKPVKVLAYRVTMRGPRIRKDGKNSISQSSSLVFHNEYGRGGTPNKETISQIPEAFKALLKGEQRMREELYDVFYSIGGN